jgi:hypothetical protein
MLAVDQGVERGDANGPEHRIALVGPRTYVTGGKEVVGVEIHRFLLGQGVVLVSRQ